MVSPMYMLTQTTHVQVLSALMRYQDRVLVGMMVTPPSDLFTETLFCPLSLRTIHYLFF